MIRTRVGYAGGEKENPTYRNLGNHTETVQVDYDPDTVSYEALLDIFWDSHDPAGGPWPRQYMAAVFYHGEAQRKAAESAKERIAARTGNKVNTQILPLKEFYLAEDYHQKYALRRHRQLMSEFQAMYPTSRGIVDSTAASRINGYLDGWGECDRLKAEIGEFGLSNESQKQLINLVCRR